MKALIFAAGRGERLKPFTDHTPKPLAMVKGKPLIQYHIEALQAAGITDLVINVSWLYEKIVAFVTQLLKRDAFQQLNVEFSIEQDYPLETGGGMLKALPLLGQEPFVVVNADIYTDFDFKTLGTLDSNQLVKLLLVKNPAHNQSGDFAVVDQQLALKSKHSHNYTYAGIGVYHPDILAAPIDENEFPTVFSIVPYIKAAITNNQAGAILHVGQWHDVGTAERLDATNRQ